MRTLLLLLALLPAGCAGQFHQALAAPDPIFLPKRFFVGSTEGTGTVKVMVSPPHATTVHGVGHMEADGTIVLDQTVEQAGAKTRHREWRLKQLSSGHYEGTLTDAVGPVIGDVVGNCFHVRYDMKSGIKAEQRLYVQPGSQTVLNRMVFRKMGVAVGNMSETIRRIG